MVDSPSRPAPWASGAFPPEYRRQTALEPDLVRDIHEFLMKRP
jgi:hypothetical protein